MEPVVSGTKKGSCTAEKNPQKTRSGRVGGSGNDEAARQYETFVDHTKEFDNEDAVSTFRATLSRVLPVRFRRRKPSPKGPDKLK